MLKAIIIDDELAARKSLDKIVQLYLSESVMVVGDADNLKTGIQLIRKLKPDIVFLDVEMPYQGGLELFDYVDINFKVVVITAYKDYAIDALRSGAFDYLLKPVNINDLKRTITKIIEANTNTPIKINEETSATDPKILVPCSKGFIVMAHTEIIAIQADGNQSQVYKINGEKVLVNKGLGAFEDCLPANHFFRLHRSALANLNFVSEINRENATVLVNNSVRLPITIGNIKPLIDKLKEILNVDID